MTKYYYNLGTYYIIKIFSILHSINIVLRNLEKNMFYSNNYIDKDLFN